MADALPVDDLEARLQRLRDSAVNPGEQVTTSPLTPADTGDDLEARLRAAISAQGNQPQGNQGILASIASRMPEPLQALGRYLTQERPLSTAANAVAENTPRPVEQAGSYALRGAGLALGTPGDIESFIRRNVQNYLGPVARDARAVVGLPEHQPVQAPQTAQGDLPSTPPPVISGRNALFPTSDQLLTAPRQAGMVDNPRLEPQNNMERFITRGAEGAGAGLIAGPRGLVSGLTGNLSSEGARQLGGGPWSQLGAGVAGGMLGSGAYTIGERLVNSIAGRWNPIGQAYETAGMSPQLAGNVSQSPAVQRVQNVAGEMLGGTGRVQSVAQSELRSFADSVDRAAARYGMARTPEQAGEALQVGARDWMQRWRTGSQEAWDNVLNILPADERIRVDNLRNVIAAVGQRMNDVPEVGNALRSDRFAVLRAAIERSPDEWRSESVRTMRTIIGQLNEARGTVGNMFSGELDQLYRGLSDDIRTAVSARPGGLDAWTAANAITSQGHQIVDRIVNPLIANSATPSTAWQFATSQINARTGGGTRIGEVARTTGAGGDVASALLSGQGARTLESNTPSTFAQLADPRSARGLAPEAANELFGAAGSPNRGVVDALNLIARNARATERFANTSRTAPNNQLISYLSQLPVAAAAMGGMATGAVPPSIGIPGAAMAVAQPAMGWLAARATTSPTIARMLAAQSTAPETTTALIRDQIIRDLIARRGGGFVPAGPQ